MSAEAKKTGCATGVTEQQVQIQIQSGIMGAALHGRRVQIIYENFAAPSALPGNRLSPCFPPFCSARRCLWQAPEGTTPFCGTISRWFRRNALHKGSDKIRVKICSKDRQPIKKNA